MGLDLKDAAEELLSDMQGCCLSQHITSKCLVLILVPPPVAMEMETRHSLCVPWPEGRIDWQLGNHQPLDCFFVFFLQR